jgi:Ca2+-transporting ATPase
LRERANPTLKWILTGAVLLVVLLLTIPALRDAFRFGPLRPTEWLVATAAGLAGVGWFELYKTTRAH